MNSFTWLLRREVWEHRAVYIVPLVFLTLLAVMYTWGLQTHGPGGTLMIDIDGDRTVSLREMIETEPHALQVMKLGAGALPFIVPGIMLNGVMLFLWFFYLTDSLYADRKDRSVLFWKSLPVTDTSTVMSKLATAMVTIPLLTLAGILISVFLMSISNSVFAWRIGQSAWDIVWSQVPFISGTLTMVYALAVQSLWFVPVFGWLLLTSAWAPRAPALWALLPPAGIALLEAATLRSTDFLVFLARRLEGVVPTAFRDEDIDMVKDSLHQGGESIDWAGAFGLLIDPQSFLSDPGMWGGLAVGAVFIAGAVWLRRYRGEN